MNKHTPGPWTATRDPNAIMDDDWCIGAQGQIDHVAVCSERDARLIAAAPDLLDALVLLVAGVENSCSDTFIPMVKAKAAIAKAEGRS